MTETTCWTSSGDPTDAHLFRSSLELAVLELLRGQGYAVVHGPDIDPDKPYAERANWNQTTLDQRLGDALHRINPGIPTAAIEEAFRTLTTIDTPALIDRNHAAHWHVVNGASEEPLSGRKGPGVH